MTEYLIDLKGKRASTAELDAKLSAVRSALGGDEDSGKLLQPFVDRLRDHTPLAFFIEPDEEELVAWLRTFYLAFLNRNQEVAVHLLTPTGSKRVFLVANAVDAPFLLHSLQSVLIRQKIRFHVVCHPLIPLRREKGKIVDLDLPKGEGELESFIIVELEQRLDKDEQEFLLNEATRVLSLVLEVRQAREGMCGLLRGIADQADQREAPFWRWLIEDNFLPFSYKSFELSADGDSVREIPSSHLGLPWKVVRVEPGHFHPLHDLPEEFRTRLKRPSRVVVEQTVRNSPIYREEKLIYIGCRRQEGDKLVEHAFLGLFAPKVHEEPTLAVPVLRERVEAALERLHIPHGCHDWRKAIEIVNAFPKVELFFMADDELEKVIRVLANIYRHGAVKVVPAHGLTVRGLTLLVIMPAHFYSPADLPRMEGWLKRFFKAEIVTSRLINLTSDYLSLHVNVQREDTWEPEADISRLERGLTHLARPWDSRLQHRLEQQLGEEVGRQLWKRWEKVIGSEYRHMIHPRFAVRDLMALEQLIRDGKESFGLWGPFPSPDGVLFRLQFYSRKRSYLNDLMPLIENLSLCVIDEVDFSFEIDRQSLYIKSFTVQGPGEADLAKLKVPLLDALTALRDGRLENDYLNRLIPLSGLGWRQIDIFRAYRNYYHQLGSPYTKKREAFALINNPDVARLLFRYFEGRFQPMDGADDLLEREEKLLMPVRMELIRALEKVSDVNEDSILRTFFNLMDSTVRSNYFLRHRRDDYFLSFKISAIGIIDMPAPRPLYETYVHSASMEGIHLRGGKVARGGIRWSDRPDDFRTEVLGLMKTQMTKNALIVPVGSKGGFVVKTPFQTRDEGMTLSKKAYQTFMRGLLDLCDNRQGEEVIRPEGIVAYDGDDPYLVVAADKGTAHLPDTANGISAEYRYWLKDAFASGGSKGYDHKKLGITARGAWVCVQRHFREIGIDVQEESVSVVGIGDMSGDVFGNGMLQSKALKLLAAFNHRHIFLDPDPDAVTSWQERMRLFDLPRSGWDDYNLELISEGGGVFSRDAKDIPLSSQVRAWLGVRHTSMDPEGLIRLLLTAQVDLLWNGGIGTYVKASSEKHEDAGDRANDTLRVDADRLQVRVVGEGGNLGFTQRARIEYALGGGRINTDAIDNSGGVDCSDHEVNLKIFLHRLMESGRVAGEDERDRLLESAADEVCDSVLHNNYTQSLCLSLDRLRCLEAVSPFINLIDRLVEAGLLDRKGEFLPAAREIAARPEQDLSRPEIAILLAYSKMQIYQALLESPLPGAEETADTLVAYFPPEFRKTFGSELAGHPLAVEITATMLTNRLVDQAGCTFAAELVRETGATLVEVVSTYMALDRVFDAPKLRSSLSRLDNRLPAGRQYELLLDFENLLAHFCRWALNRQLGLRLGREEIADYSAALQQFLQLKRDALDEEQRTARRTSCDELLEAGLDQDAVDMLVDLPLIKDFLVVMSLSSATKQPFAAVGSCLEEVTRRLQLTQLQASLDRVVLQDRWDRQAKNTLELRIGALRYGLALAAWEEGEGECNRFFRERRGQVQVYHAMLSELAAVPRNLHPFSVLVGMMEKMLDQPGRG